ncbi:DUF624 domain-containing protein [Gracilibacillus timonensis]|uniref:DUF624 domain-containing protein n=1 Tax=Gracilibacillus timonensis TaxID=1816696 RepID=UPI000824C9C7|nr:DUF624 domain-containing protein [Gracilibacillus timonensis]
MNGNSQHFGGFYSFSRYAFWLITLNFLFIVSNIIALLAFMVFIPSISNALFYFLSLIPTGAACSTTFYLLSLSPDQTDKSLIKTFMKVYRRNFVDVSKVWLPILIVFFLFIIDIQYFQQEYTVFNQAMNGLFLVLLVLLSIFSLYALMITAHFHFRVRDVYRLAVYYMFTKIKVTTGNMAIGFLTLVGMFFISDFIILFIASLVAWFLTINSAPVLEDIKNHFMEKKAINGDEPEVEKGIKTLSSEV